MKNNKKGFTLAEMLMVVGIVVILSGATVIGVVSWLHSAKDTAAKLEQENGDNFENDARKAVESVKGTAPSHVVNQTNLNTPAPTAKPTEKPTEAPKPTSKPNDPTPTTKPDDPTPTPVDPSPTTKPTNGGGNSVTVGAATVPNGFGQSGGGPENVGVSGISQSGNSTTVSAFQSTNTIKLTFTPSGNSYTMTFNNGMQWMLQGMPGYDYNKPSYSLTSEQRDWLSSKFGFTLK